MKLTPKEAITVIRNLQDWLYFSSMNGGTKIQREALDIAVNAIEKQIQSEESFEWCDGCKEYDQEQHCCHRYSKVIRQAVAKMKVVHCIDCRHSEYDEVYKDRYCPYNGSTQAESDRKTAHTARDHRQDCRADEQGRLCGRHRTESGCIFPDRSEVSERGDGL